MQQGIKVLTDAFNPKQGVVEPLITLGLRYVACNRKNPQIAVSLDPKYVPTDIIEQLDKYKALGTNLFEAVFRQFTPIEHNVLSVSGFKCVGFAQATHQELLYCGIDGLLMAKWVGGEVKSDDLKKCLTKIEFLITFAKDKPERLTNRLIEARQFLGVPR